jgi:hypothetical protein
MSAEDFKLETPETPTVMDSNTRGRKVKTSKVPSLPARNTLKETGEPKTANINLIFDSFDPKSTANKKLRDERNSQQLESVGAFLLFVLTSGISIAYYVTFKTYHASLAKMDALKALLANPKARVASGAKGKSILVRINADKKKKENPNKIVKSTKVDETAQLIKQLIEARKVEKNANQYEAPLLEASKPNVEAPKTDATMDLIKKLLAERATPKVEAPKVFEPAPQALYQLPPVGNMPMMQYPVFSAPMPTIQYQAPALIAEAPKKVEASSADSLANLSK